MSTRSGKRIHSSIHEATEEVVSNNNERKTRSRRQNDNNENTIAVKQGKKHKNYVHFPKDSEDDLKIVADKEAPIFEQNTKVLAGVENFERTTRQTRRNKKKSETDITEQETTKTSKQKKKSKKNKKLFNSYRSEQIQSSKNERKYENEDTKEHNNSVNKSTNSTDSFHSAAESPDGIHTSTTIKKTHSPHTNSSRRVSKRLRSEGDQGNDDDMKENHVTKKRKLSIPDIGQELSECDISHRKDATFDKSNGEIHEIVNVTLDKDTKRNSKKLNSTYDKDDTPTSKKLNSSNNKSLPTIKVTVSSEVIKSARKSSRLCNDTPTSDRSVFINLTTNSPDQNLLNCTFEKPNLNSTYEKLDSDTNSGKKSSLISLDSTINLTFDKCVNGTQISISSDESVNENSSFTPEKINNKEKNVSSKGDKSCRSRDNSIMNVTITQNDSKSDLKPVVTPLIRERTFTKDDAVAMSPKLNQVNGTPVKHLSFPTAGCTPFHLSESWKKKKVLNVTHSIEKRRSSLAPTPSASKVMFCSPVNGQLVVAQQKRKVIKSNLKGSNKSFVYEESDSLRQATARKRSQTQIETRRLPRARTANAIVKIADAATPSKKPATPSTAKSELSRTKLPNFAALHQRQFAKMESLDECQTRKAQRARQLLTPKTRSAMKTSSALSTKSIQTEKKETGKKAKETAREASKNVEIPKNIKLQTLSSLQPGYTRFGFKMPTEVNPFSFTNKSEVKPKDIKPYGIITRQPTQPSLTGATVPRKEVAKQTVMREKSFTSLAEKRNMSRKENRTTIKGVRTNRRFELQMMHRNING